MYCSQTESTGQSTVQYHVGEKASLVSHGGQRGVEGGSMVTLH